MMDDEKGLEERDWISKVHYMWCLLKSTKIFWIQGKFEWVKQIRKLPENIEPSIGRDELPESANSWDPL